MFAFNEAILLLHKGVFVHSDTFMNALVSDYGKSFEKWTSKGE